MCVPEVALSGPIGGVCLVALGQQESCNSHWLVEGGNSVSSHKI